jgi:hypothetical protein
MSILFNSDISYVPVYKRSVVLTFMIIFRVKSMCTHLNLIFLRRQAG